MCEIKNNIVYLNKMRKTFIDKSWFMSIIPSEITTIIDFGCADNTFNEFLRNSFPEYRYIGIDNNKDFIKIVKAKGEEIYESIDEFIKNNEYDPDNTLLVLNSVVHEIYSYYDINKFMEELNRLNAKYIAFRDMYARNCGIYGSRIEEELENMALNNVVIAKHYLDFIKHWGGVEDGYSAMHFLLKYFYTENWSKELKENYLPYHYRELHEKVRKIGYNITFERFYALPYLKEKWHEDFKCDENPHLKTFIDRITTHLKLFLVRGFDK